MSLEHSAARQKKAKSKHHRVRPQPQPIEPDCYYDAEQLARRWGIHPMTVWAWSRDNKIPRATKLGPNISRWLGAEILAHEQAARQRSDT